MLKFVTALSAALIIGGALVGSATTASAGYRHHGCCGPIPPSYTYNTKNVYKKITRHHDVWRTKYVKRTKHIVHVTRIQPIVHVHNVTRVHTRIVGVVHPVHQRVTQWLPARKYVTNSVVHLRPECGCSYGRY
ncbi:MAG TPA: hypothetical protein VGO49_07410 [Bradyrhizobium sp.]|jgi:hypothetical protein|nr:hypothetical protein [Bradyrhizobium sp.]